MDGCRLCAISEGNYAFGCDAPVISERGYFGVASIGGFIPGWTLVCPDHHRNNLSVDYATSELHQTVSAVVNAVTAEFGQAAIFEHGATRDGSPTSCGTSHAHLHVVPFAEDLADLAIANYDPSLSWVPTRLTDIARASGGREYLFVASRYTGLETVGYLALLREPRSQFFRRLIAAHLKAVHLADYRVAPLEHVGVATAERLSVVLKNAQQRAA